MVATSLTPSRSVLLGQVIAGKYPLLSILAEAENSILFTTELPDSRQPAVIRIVSEPAADLEAKWREVMKLSHPHLLRILDCGECSLPGSKACFAVLEYADDSLASVLERRALSPEEMTAALLPAVEALEFLHARGLQHGRLKPANVLATGETLKLSCESISAGESTVDLQALGAIVIESLTRRPIVGDGLRQTEILRDPFAAIARGCLNRTISLAEIERALGVEPPAAEPAVNLLDDEEPAPAHSYTVPLLVAVFIAVVALTAFSLFHGNNDKGKLAQPARVVTAPPSRGEVAPTVVPPTVNAVRPVEQPAPQPSERARQSIHGTVKVRVRANVDANGSVYHTEVLRRGPSRYFANLSLETLRHWSFGPNQEGMKTIEFRYRRNGASAEVIR